MALRTIVFSSRPLALIARRYLWSLPVIITLGLLASAFEGVGIGLIIPLLGVLDESGGGGSQGGIMGRLMSFADHLAPEERLYAIATAMLLLIVLKNAIAYANRMFVAYVRGRASHEIRIGLADRLLNVGFPFFLEQSPGRLINIMATETWKTSEAIQMAFGMIAAFSAVVIFTVFLFVLSWELTLAVVFGLLAIQGIQALMSRRLGLLSDAVIAHNNRLASRMLDSVHATRLVRLFGQEAGEHARFAADSDAVRAAGLALERRQWAIQPAVEVLHTALFLAVLIGAWQAGVAFPVLVAFIALLYRMQPHVRTIQTSLAQVQSWSGSIREVDWLLNTSDKPPPPTGRLRFDGLASGISFNSVSFRYAAGPPVLRGVSFRIQRGRATAIIGRSGAGKTTITSLLCRFLEPSDGVILVDGRSLSAIDPNAWRRRLALASQDLELVDGTIYDNILYGAPGKGLADAEAAARLADAHDFVCALPDGYRTLAGYRGVNLSSGQRQRIALARALARDPDILILDEATNAVDGISEASIFRAVRHRAGDRTTIVISHRRSTLAFCDDGVVLKDGRVVACGPLAELKVLEDADIYD